MPQRRVLFVDNTRLTAYRLGRGGVESEAGFIADPAGLAAFAAYLAAHRDSIFMMLVDVVEEGFQTEDIPYSRGKDRRALVTRKLSQHFYGTPYALAQSQGRLKAGRRDERLLLMALTQPQHFDSWFAALHESRIILAGIWSLPQVICGLLPRQAPAQLLLLTQTRAGLRQTFFAAGLLRFSRLSPLLSDSAEAAAIAASGEALKMHQYLASQRLIERDKPLPTWVLTHPAAAANMRTRCRNTAELEFEILDLLQEAGRAGLHSQPADSRAEMLFCQLLAKKPPAEQFAPPAERQFHRLWQARFALKAASLLIFAGGLLFAAHQGVDILQLRESTEAARQQAQLNETAYAAKLQALPKIPLSTDDLRALIDRFEQVGKRAQGPAPLLIQLSRSLDAFPPIMVEHLDWAMAEQLAPTAPGGSAAAAVPAHLASGPYAQITLAAQLPLGMVGDHRGQLTLVTNFTKHLAAATPDTLVTVLQPPVDTQSEKTLKSSDETSTPEPPRFVLRLTRKL